MICSLSGRRAEDDDGFESVLASISLENIRRKVEDLSEVSGHHEQPSGFMRQRADNLPDQVRHQLHCATKNNAKPKAKPAPWHRGAMAKKYESTEKH